MSSKLLRRLLLLPLVLFLGLELVLWVFVRLPVEPPRRLELRNELPGFKGEVRVVFDGCVLICIHTNIFLYHPANAKGLRDVEEALLRDVEEALFSVIRYIHTYVCIIHTYV